MLSKETFFICFAYENMEKSPEKVGCSSKMVETFSTALMAQSAQKEKMQDLFEFLYCLGYITLDRTCKNCQHFSYIITLGSSSVSVGLWNFKFGGQKYSKVDSRSMSRLETPHVTN